MFDTGMRFALGDEIGALRDTVHRFAQAKIAPRAGEIDAANEFPCDLWEALGALGLHGITVEEELGGAGMGYLAHVVAMEELSRASASVGLSYGAHSNLCVNQIRRNGSDAQRRRHLPKLLSGEHVGALAMSEPGAGSDVVAMKPARGEAQGRPLRAQRNQDVDHQRPRCRHVLVVYAKTDADAGPRGITAFLIERGIQAGFSVAPEARQARACGAPTPASWCSRTARCPTGTCSARRAAEPPC